MSSGTESTLLERDRELAALHAAVERCRGGSGGAIVIEGPAGIGKTSLLGYAREVATTHGVRVVGARGAELEQSFPYGVVRQLFESFLFSVPADARTTWMRDAGDAVQRLFGGGAGEVREPAEEFALLHSLYWLCVSIADEQPLMMVLDDAQWSDAPSLHFVEFAARRLEQLPFMFVVATRVPDDHSPASLVSLIAEPTAEVLRPAPLSLDAVDRLVRERIDADADVVFSRACHEVTSGNPFLLRELVHEVLDERLEPSADAAVRVRALGPRGVARVVLLRLRRLPDAARQLAAALSVAADGLRLVDVGTLAGLDEHATTAAAAGLESAEIVDLRGGVRFTHPVVRTAVYEDLPAGERAAIHFRAAQMKAEQGRPATEVAAQLLHVDPGDDPWVVEVLLGAGREAFAAGDFSGAERIFARALKEQPADDRRAELVAELGRAEARTGNPDGSFHLDEAARTITDPERGAAASIELANVLKLSGEADQAAAVLLDAISRLERLPDELDRRLHAELLGTRFVSPVDPERIGTAMSRFAPPRGEPQDLLDSFLLAAAAFDAVAALEPAAAAVELGRRALSGDRVPHDPALGGQALIVAGVALIWAEDFDFARECYSEALADAQAAASAFAVGNFSTMRAMCCYRAGRLLEAEADSATVLELVPEVAGLETLLAPAFAYAVLSGIERGTPLEAVSRLASDPRLARATDVLPYTQVCWARGELHLVLGNWERALAAFRECDRPEPGFGGGNPSMVPWREGAALAHHRLGHDGAARELAADAVTRARRFGAPRALGIALRADALVQEGPARIAGLHDAVEVLERADSRLELARTRRDLGAALRVAGQRMEAQTVLERAHELAVEIGAVRIAESAADDLVAAGARPRREPAAGLAALMPSERRVATLAAAGKTNREIAQALFVTEKTVETHLGHVYDKLGVRSRRRLSAALGPAAAA